MSKKVLLEGRTKIRWGRLAGIKSDAEARDEERRLRNRLFEGMGGMDEEPVMEEEDDLYEMMYEEEEELLDDEGAGDMGPDVEGGDEMAMADAGMDHEEPDADQLGGPSDMDADNMGGGAAAGNEAIAAELAVAVAGAIEDVLGVAVDVDSDVDMDDEGMDDMGGEEEMEMGDEEPMDDMGEEEPEEGGEEMEMGGEEEELAESRRARRVAREVVRLLMRKK